LHIGNLSAYSNICCNLKLKYEAGKESIIKTKDRAGEKIISTTNAYRLTIISNTFPRININKFQDNYIDYSGKVYCCQVPGEGLIYVRRKGIPVWCGNSRHGLTFQPVTGGCGFVRIQFES
jgi:replicative DNA helicase Mcm